MKHKRHHPISSYLLKVGLLLASIVYGFCHDKFLSACNYRVAASIDAAVVVGLLLLILEEAFGISMRLRHGAAREEQDAAKAHAERVLERERIIGPLYRKIEHELSGILAVTDFETFRQYQVDHSSFALSSYKQFLRELVDRASAKRKQTALVVHSCEIEVWWNQDAKQMIDLQEEFIKKCRGNRIARILCGAGPAPSEKMIAAAERMHAVGIELYYYDLESRSVDHDFSWDFLVVEETNVAAIWTATSPRGEVRTAVYTSSGAYNIYTPQGGVKSYPLVPLWKRIAHKSIRFPGLPGPNQA